MATYERIDVKPSISSSLLLQQLAAVLPKGINFNIYHISTPPLRTSSLYSAPPNTRPDRTYCESHFLTASIRTTENGNTTEPVEVLIFAVEVLIYTTAYDTTLFVSKADSTGYLHLLRLPKGSSSPLREISGTFLKYLVQQRRRHNKRSIVSLFARAQDQYLFPGSVEYEGKHVLDDRGLVRWWCRVLSPLVEQPSNNTQWTSVGGYLIVPGLDSHETLSYVPTASRSKWAIGHPLRQISRHSNDVPPRCLIPHFPDDPKSRYLDELDEEITKGQDSESGNWRSVRTIDQFWDMMAYRQECSAGRLVGFIWIVFTPSSTNFPLDQGTGNSQSTVISTDSERWDAMSTPPLSGPELPISPSTSFNAASQVQSTSQTLDPKLNGSFKSSSASSRTQKKAKLTGPIVTRQPRIKTHNKNYLLDRPESTAYYEWRQEGRGQVIVDEADYKRATELLLRLDFANLGLAGSSSSRWIHEVRSGATEDMRDVWGQSISGTKVQEFSNASISAGVNVLNMGLVRKKRKAGETEAVPGVVSAQASPPVNVLAASSIRGKVKT